MKYVLALAAAAGLAVWGCAPKPGSQGGTYDPEVTAHDRGHSGRNNGLPEGSLDPNALPGTIPHEFLPGGSNDSQPEFVLPEHKNEVLRI